MMNDPSNPFVMHFTTHCFTLIQQHRNEPRGTRTYLPSISVLCYVVMTGEKGEKGAQKYWDKKPPSVQSLLWKNSHA